MKVKKVGYMTSRKTMTSSIDDREIPCGACKGRGYSGTFMKCSTCNGTSVCKATLTDWLKAYGFPSDAKTLGKVRQADRAGALLLSTRHVVSVEAGNTFTLLPVVRA